MAGKAAVRGRQLLRASVRGCSAGVSGQNLLAGTRSSRKAPSQQHCPWDRCPGTRSHGSRAAQAILTYPGPPGPPWLRSISQHWCPQAQGALGWRGLAGMQPLTKPLGGSLAFRYCDAEPSQASPRTRDTSLSQLPGDSLGSWGWHCAFCPRKRRGKARSATASVASQASDCVLVPGQ